MLETSYGLAILAVEELMIQITVNLTLPSPDGRRGRDQPQESHEPLAQILSNFGGEDKSLLFQ